MLAAPTRPAAWHLLWELRLIDTIYRFLKFSRKEPEVSQGFLFDRIVPGEEIPFGLALAGAAVCYRLRTDASLGDVRSLFAKQEVNAAVHAMRQALKISNDESDSMRGTLAGLHPLLADEYPSVARLKRFLAEPTAGLSRKLMDALTTRGIHRERIERLQRDLSQLAQTEFAPIPFINGDLLTQHGLKPGPLFKRILEAVYDAQLEGRVNSRDEALAMALRQAQNPPAPL
jgi:hypothetical protein